MNLIDCFDMIIVEAKESMLWATLSYVWGNSECREVEERTERYRAGSRLSSKIPRTVADAITVTKKLGFRFLWVDEYCIDQSDEQHRSSQITRMDDIYRGGELTIVAAAGANKHHGLPGVSSTQRIGSKSIRVGKLTLLSHGCPPSELIQASKWFARAWTFQEAILSRRMLIFTERQTSFYCTESSWREESRGTVALEAGAEDLQLKHPRPVPLILAPSKLTFELCWLRMVHLAYSYSQREMTFEADALNGFLGVLHDIQRSRPGTYHLSGLPFFRRSDDDTDDDLARIMFTALAWILARESQASIEPRRKMFPSWTWVGWGTCISY
ncbi:heterokaryon incompatibility protein-domain-containing protein, partial [Paraphoma chrysanthemicola]